MVPVSALKACFDDRLAENDEGDQAPKSAFGQVERIVQSIRREHPPGRVANMDSLKQGREE